MARSHELKRPIAADEDVTFDYSWKGDQDKYEKKAPPRRPRRNVFVARKTKPAREEALLH